MKRKAKLSAYKPRLASLLKRPGGVTAEQATKAAQDNLGSIRQQSLIELDKTVAELAGMREALKTEPFAAQADHLYALAGTVAGIAGAFGLSDVQAAASSLCELIDELDVQRRSSFEAIDVHLRGLQLLRTPGQEMSPGEAAAILAGLSDVVKTVVAKKA